MAVPPRVLPRRAEPTDLMKVTPSGQVNFQGRASGGVPQVRASSAIQQPTPYIGKAAKRTDLFELAEGLQYFNGEIGKLAYTQRQQWEEGQVEKAKTEAITNPEKTAEVFRMGLDKATEQGLFPRYAHPKYRLAYLEQGAKNIALSGLPAFLEEKTQSLASADSTEPIEATINSLVDQYANESGISQSPIAYAAFRESAFPSVLRVGSARREERERNFNTARVEGLEQNINGQTSSLLSAMSLDKEADREIATDLAMRNLQTTYDNIRRDFPQLDATKQFTSSFISSLNSSVSNGEMTPRDASQVLDVAVSSLKSGTGAWADIADVQSSIAGIRASWENEASRRGNLAKQQVNEKDKAFEEGVLDAFQQAMDNGSFTLMNNTSDVLAITEKVAAEVYPELLGNEEALQRRGRELRVKMAELAETEENQIVENRIIDQLILDSPEEAISFIQRQRDSGSMTKASYEKYIKQAQESNDIIAFLNEGGFDKKRSDIEGIAKRMIAPSMMSGMSFGEIDPLTIEQQSQIAEIQTFGENAFREAATAAVRAELNADPSLRQPQKQAERVAAVERAVNEAWNTTQKSIGNYTQQRDAFRQQKEEDQKAQLNTYGAMTQKVSLAEEAINAISLQDGKPNYGTVTTPANVSYKLFLNRSAKELGSLASKISTADKNAPEYKQLTSAYQRLLSITGYGPDAILSGKSEHGVPIPLDNIKQDPIRTPIFRNYDEFRALWEDSRMKAAQETKPTQSLLDFLKQEGVEGFTPTAIWDYKQWSVGYGTRGVKGETLTREEAEVRLQEELKQHENAVDTAAENADLTLTQGQRNALISFDFNTGAAASVIQRFAGDPAGMKRKMMEYNGVVENGQKRVLKGLVNRRLKEIAMFDSGNEGVTEVSTEPSKLAQLMKVLGIDTPKEEKEFIQTQTILSKQRTL
jgi:GH24 family phage-related lysozyme (muramidase)